MDDTRGSGRSPMGRLWSWSKQKKKKKKIGEIARMIGCGRWVILLLSSAMAKPLGWVRALMAWSISAGPMPTHIAFIMDGNRRFADRLHVDRHIGHSHGYDALLGTLKDCFDMNVKVVTLFAFSIDNFYRPPVEVSALMELMQSKLEVLVEKHGLAIEYGICVRVLGDLHLLPEGVRRAAEKAMSITRQNSSRVLNLCVSYTATHEIAHSIQKTCNNFLAAWDDSCGNFCHLPHCRVHKCSNEVCNADVVNGDRICESIFCIEQGKNNDHDELAGHNDGDNYGAELRMADGVGRSFAADASDGISCAGLRRRNQLNARDSNKLGLHKTCDSDSCLDMDMNGDVIGNGLPPTENAFHEVDDKSSEVVDLSYGMPNHCLSNCTTSTKGLYSQRLPCSCEDQKSLRFSPPQNFRKPCCLDDRIFKVAEDCVSEEEIEKNLYTYPCPPPDLLIRTSGETRLSNFLLWQSSFSHLAFCNALWPEFSFRHLFFIILEYQRAFPSLLKKRQCYNSGSWR